MTLESRKSRLFFFSSSSCKTIVEREMCSVKEGWGVGC